LTGNWYRGKIEKKIKYDLHLESGQLFLDKPKKKLGHLFVDGGSSMQLNLVNSAIFFSFPCFYTLHLLILYSGKVNIMHPSLGYKKSIWNFKIT
jgi:hypothetical protein